MDSTESEFQDAMLDMPFKDRLEVYLNLSKKLLAIHRMGIIHGNI